MSIKVAIIFGGDSSEYAISEKSGRVVFKNLNKSEFEPYLVSITSKEWNAYDGDDKCTILKNDFSFQKSDGAIIKFDVVFNAIHGTPGEDGIIQGYFDMLKIPYNNSGVLASALTFDKYASSNYCRQLGYRVPLALVLEKRDDKKSNEFIAEVGFPCFVKPNEGGSSFGASKVNTADQLPDAIDNALNQGSSALVEEYIEGTEVTSGVINYKGDLIALPITEIVSHGEFFDYKAKYEGASEEYTPARISEKLTLEVQNITKSLYQTLNLKGMIRADYIIKNDIPVLIEVNTIPGLTEESIVPQQSKALGIPLDELFGDSIRQCLKTK